jgi:hypothetical protein
MTEGFVTTLVAGRLPMIERAGDKTTFRGEILTSRDEKSTSYGENSTS